jgi:metal-dependent amidase/aminoacylase/carboxypeptidase family protein
MWLSNRVTSAKPKTGRVILLFQPAEDGSGAQKCFQTQNLLHLPRLCFALHFTWISKKSDYSKNDTFTCAVNSIIIKLEGITAHAGEPERDQSCDGDSINYYNSILLFS